MRVIWVVVSILTLIGTVLIAWPQVVAKYNYNDLRALKPETQVMAIRVIGVGVIFFSLLILILFLRVGW